ncbi:MAG: hypothetical protein B7Z45_05285, partial [Azorhizobium sp. 12-66-6]
MARLDLPHPAGAEGGRGRRGRPGRRIHAEHAGDHRLHAGRFGPDAKLLDFLGADLDLVGRCRFVVLLPLIDRDVIHPHRVTFERVPFNQPLYIAFSSGTTGVPKCIVHGVGGTLLQHLKEHRYQCDLNAGDRLFYFSTCGWMMWNWLVSGLGIGATLCLFDGSPFAPNPQVLFDYAQDEKFTLFGTSAKYIDSLHKEGVRPCDTHDLSSVKLITS